MVLAAPWAAVATRNATVPTARDPRSNECYFHEVLGSYYSMEPYFSRNCTGGGSGALQGAMPVETPGTFQDRINAHLASKGSDHTVARTASLARPALLAAPAPVLGAPAPTELASAPRTPELPKTRAIRPQYEGSAAEKPAGGDESEGSRLAMRALQAILLVLALAIVVLVSGGFFRRWQRERNRHETASQTGASKE